MLEFEQNNNNTSRVFTEADFDGSRPAPFRLVGRGANPETIARQDVLIENMQAACRHELSRIATDEVADFVTNGVVSRMHMREALNSYAFSNRLHTFPLPWLVKDHSWLETFRSSHATIHGARTVVQSDIAQRAFEMESIEYKNVTMFGEFRRDLEAPMWDEMSDFLGVDASPKAEQVYRTDLLGFSSDILKGREIGAMRIGLKRTIPGGILNNGTEVKVRTTASINTSHNSDFDQSVLHSLREAQFEANRDDKKVDLSQNPEFIRYVGYLIDNKLPAGLVLARNETAYGGNAIIAAKARERNERRRRRNAFFKGAKRLIDS